MRNASEAEEICGMGAAILNTNPWALYLRYSNDLVTGGNVAAAVAEGFGDRSHLDVDYLRVKNDERTRMI